MGRLSTYTVATADAICARLSTGEPLRAICRAKGMPSWHTVYDWIKLYPDFASRIALARDLGYDALSEECLEIADDQHGDLLQTAKGVVSNEAAISRAKLMIWTRLQLLAKWSPRYRDRADVSVRGEIAIVGLSERMRKRATANSDDDAGPPAISCD